MAFFSLALGSTLTVKGGAALLPFGTAAGDETVAPGDDISSGQVSLRIGLPFFGLARTKLWVNVNGVISFEGEITTFTPQSFPFNGGTSLVAPFWADADTSGSGNIFYRETIDPMTLVEAQHLVDEHGSAHLGFQVEMVFVATWQEVPAFGGMSSFNNTFQCVLMTDGRRTLAAFLYAKVQWTTGSASDGTPAQVGFDAGDGARFHAIPQSRTAEILNVTMLSNTGHPGLFFYRIDDRTFGSGPGCSGSGGSMGVSPLYDTPHGGELLTLTVGEECLHVEDEPWLSCVFTMEFDGATWAMPGVVIDSSHLRCIAPLSGRAGRARLGLSFDGGNSTVLQTHFYFISTIKSTAAVSSGVGSGDLGIVLYQGDASQNLTVTWEPEVFADLPEGLDLLALRINGSKIMEDVAALHVIAEALPNSGVLEISALDFSSSILVGDLQDADAEFWTSYQLLLVPHIIDDEEPGGQGRRLALPAVGIAKWSLRWLGQHLAKRSWRYLNMMRQPLILSEREPCEYVKDFMRWYLQRDFGQLAPVPCTPEVAEWNPGSWTVDPFCPKTANCGSHPGADICYREARQGGNCQQVCYRDGQITMDLRAAGTADAGCTGLNPFEWTNPGSWWPNLEHALLDGAPHLLLDLMCGDEGITLYREFRPPPEPDTCFDNLPRAAAAFGDPHLFTLDGVGYTFNGAGEFWFLRVDGGAALDVQARMEKLPVSGSTSSATVITALALAVPSSPTLQVGLGATGTLQVLADGEVLLFDSVLTEQELDGGTVVSLQPQGPHGHVARVAVRGLVSFEVTSANAALAIVTYGYPALMNRASGLLGVFDKEPANDFMSPTGEVLPPTANAIHGFGLSRIVQHVGESLFHYRAGQSFEGFQDLLFEPLMINVSDLLANSTAIEICGEDLACLHDLHVTGSTEFANATSSQVVEHTRAVQVIAEIEVALQQTTARTTPPATTSEAAQETVAQTTSPATSESPATTSEAAQQTVAQTISPAATSEAASDGRCLARILAIAGAVTLAVLMA